MSHYFAFEKIILRRTFRLVLSLTIVLAFASTLFAQQAHAAQATLAWSPDTSKGVAGYKVYYGPSSGNYTTNLNTGNTTTATLQNLSSSTYHIALTAYDSSNNQSGYSPELVIDSITASAGTGGTISPSGTFFLSQGANQTFTITPSAGYQTVGVQVDGKPVGAVSTYTVTGISAPHTISATFAATSATTYAITATPGSNGSISPSGSVKVNPGASQTFTITPNTGYKTANVLVDGNSVGAPSTYTFSSVSANHTISATFTSASTSYTITATPGPNGAISPSGSVKVNSGASQTFTITPAANYQISTVQVDGAAVAAVSSYAFTNVTANHTITATFAPISSYTISASVLGGGSISPSGKVSVPTGTNKSFWITPSSGYKISAVTVDGKSIGPVSSYTFTKVKANHSIVAGFARRSSPGSASAQSSGSISLSPVADAGPDQALKSGSIVTLDGSNSTDAVNGIVSYKWTQVSGPSVKLSSPSEQTCTFDAPVVASGKVLAFNLEITNTEGIVKNASCLVNVCGTDMAPSAKAGPDQTVQSHANVTLNGSGSSDPDDGMASYAWVQTEGPHVEILNAHTAHASFVAPDPGPLGASLVFQLKVRDHHGLTARDQCTVNVANSNLPPVANAGRNQSTSAASSVTLDGSGSYDSENSIGSYRWKQISGVPVTLSDPTAMTPVFTAPSVADAKSPDLLFILTVKDATGRLSATAKCVVTVKP